MKESRMDQFLDWGVLAFVVICIVGIAGFMVAMLWHLFKMI